jgi:hypothetical protein
MAPILTVLVLRLFGDLTLRDCDLNKKADVAENPNGFDHVGLLVNEPPGTAGLLFI